MTLRKKERLPSLVRTTTDKNSRQNCADGSNKVKLAQKELIAILPTVSVSSRKRKDSNKITDQLCAKST